MIINKRERNFFRKNKSQIESSTLSRIILLIIGFAIVLGFFASFSWGEEINRQVCHQSVIARASMSDRVDELKDLVPLKCETAKICITENMFSEGDCEKELGEDFVNKRVDLDENFDNQVNKIFAEELASLWSTMGEGKVQLFKKELSSKTKSKCLLFTRIAFDEDIKNEKNYVRGASRYLYQNKVPNKNEKYSEYLFNQKDLPKKYDQNKDFMTTSQKALIFMEADLGSFGEAASKYGLETGIGAGLGLACLALGPGAPICASVGALGVLATAIYQYFFAENAYLTSYMLLDYNKKDLFSGIKLVEKNPSEGEKSDKINLTCDSFAGIG